jgi:hypothetical protein
MSRYAEDTRVPVDQSRMEIERALARYGASGFGFSWERREVAINPIPAYGKENRAARFLDARIQLQDAQGPSRLADADGARGGVRRRGWNNRFASGGAHSSS